MAGNLKCEAWAWKAGQVLTTVAFFGGASEDAGNRDAKGGFWSQHLTLNLHYEAADGEAHLTDSYATARLDDCDPLDSPFDNLRQSGLVCITPEDLSCKLKFKRLLSVPAYVPLVLSAPLLLCARNRRKVCFFTLFASLLVAAILYRHYQNMHRFVGNTRDRAAVPPPADLTQLLLLLVPSSVALLLIILVGEAAPRAVAPLDMAKNGHANGKNGHANGKMVASLV